MLTQDHYEVVRTTTIEIDSGDSVSSNAPLNVIDYSPTGQNDSLTVDTSRVTCPNSQLLHINTDSFTAIIHTMVKFPKTSFHSRRPFTHYCHAKFETRPNQVWWVARHTDQVWHLRHHIMVIILIPAVRGASNYFLSDAC
jgi:hypothetical protein